MYIQRKIEGDILAFLERPEILAIVGPRQCGKTTTLHKIYSNLENAIFITFEDPEILGLFEHNIKQFAQTYVKDYKYVFIDEFQYAKNGGKLLKLLYDKYHTKIIISGSSAVDLTIKAVKFLVGRIFILPMFTFSFYEFLTYRDPVYVNLYQKQKINFNHKKISNQLALEQELSFSRYYEEYLIWGGYPEVVLAKNNQEKEMVLKNIYSTYFLREVKNILHLSDDYKMSKLIKALALQIGQMIEYKELTEITETSIMTVKRYLNFLDKTYISGLIRPFYQNKRKEIVKNQKVYFYDTGFRNASISDFRPLDLRNDKGELIENGLWTEFTKNQISCMYWRDKNKNEIDFILELSAGKNFAIEVKYNANRCRLAPKVFMIDYPEFIYLCAYLKTGKQMPLANQIFIPLL